MSITKKIRILLALLITITILGMSLFVPIYPLYLEVIKVLAIPFSVVLGGYFSVDVIKNNKNSNEV